MEKDQDQVQSKKATEEAKTVGEFLRYTRLSQKKTIEGVAKALCIRKIYIKAIEENNFKELPPIPYGVGFVRSYAAFLGLNVDRIVQCYKEEAMPKKQLNKPVVKSHNATTRPNRYQILFGLLGLALLYGLWFAYSNYVGQPEKVIDEPTPIEQPIDEPVQIEEQVTNEEVQDEALETQTPEEIIVEEEPAQPEPEVEKGMVIKLTGESWIEVRDENKIYISGIYDKGFEYKVPNKDGLIFSVGRQRNVEVYLDGELIQVTRPQKQTNIRLNQFLNH